MMRTARGSTTEMNIKKIAMSALYNSKSVDGRLGQQNYINLENKEDKGECDDSNKYDSCDGKDGDKESGKIALTTSSWWVAWPRIICVNRPLLIWAGQPGLWRLLYMYHNDLLPTEQSATPPPPAQHGNWSQNWIETLIF